MLEFFGACNDHAVCCTKEHRRHHGFVSSVHRADSRARSTAHSSTDIESEHISSTKAHHQSQLTTHPSSAGLPRRPRHCPHEHQDAVWQTGNWQRRLQEGQSVSVDCTQFEANGQQSTNTVARPSMSYSYHGCFGSLATDAPGIRLVLLQLASR